MPGFVQIFMWVLACAMVGFPALMASLGCFWLLSERVRGPFERRAALVLLIIALVLWAIFLVPLVRLVGAVDKTF